MSGPLLCRLNQYQGAHAFQRAPSFPFLCRAASSSSSAKKTWQYVIIWQQFTSTGIKNDGHLLVVKHHQVTPTHVKAREMIKSILCIINVLIHHERRTTSVRSIPQANLSYGAKLKHEKRACSERATSKVREGECSARRCDLAEDVVHLLRRDLKRQVAHVQRPVHLRRQPHILAGAGRHGCEASGFNALLVVGALLSMCAHYSRTESSYCIGRTQPRNERCCRCPWVR